MKILKQFLVVLALMTIALTMVQAPVLVFAEEDTPPPAAEDPKTEAPKPATSTGLFPLTGSEKYGGVPAPSAGASAEQQFAEITDGLIQAVRAIIGAVAILMIVYSGFRMVTGWGKEEVYTKSKQAMLWAIVGLAVVAMAGEMRDVFRLDATKSFLKDPNAILRSSVLFNQTTQTVIVFLKYFIGSVAVLFIVRNGLRLIVLGSSEDKIALDKKNLVYSVIGLMLIIISDTAINNVFYKLDLSKHPGAEGAQPAIDPVQGIKEIVGFTNFIVALVGPFAVLALLAGGVMYIIAGGEEEKMNKAKKLILAALVGIVIIYGAFAIVSTFVAGQFG